LALGQAGPKGNPRSPDLQKQERVQE